MLSTEQVIDSLIFYFPNLHIICENKNSKSLQNEGSNVERINDYKYAIEWLAKLLNNSDLSYCRINQILHLIHEAGQSEGFYKYYFLSHDLEIKHIYPVNNIQRYYKDFSKITITSLNHLLWGLSRIYVDALLIFGNVRTAYKKLRSMSFDELCQFYERKRYDIYRLEGRGDCLTFEEISKEHRYFVSEIVREKFAKEKDVIIQYIKNNFTNDMVGRRLGEILNINNSSTQEKESELQNTIIDIFQSFSSEEVNDQSDIDKMFTDLEETVRDVQTMGKTNNKLYITQGHDLDVYIATSMRNRNHFEETHDRIDTLFNDQRLIDLKLRYFDPTNCVADNPLDKGLTECLMVKCAKVLIYFAGENDSFGKDAEAAIALSLGKPVIILCDENKKEKFFKYIHPLTRLIDFQTGVACGAIVTSKIEDVQTILYRIFTNEMMYKLERLDGNGTTLVLKESDTCTITRLETNNKLLSEAFWNNYHNVE